MEGELRNTKIDEGRLHFEGSCWYVCQNKFDGADCKNKQGYKYSFVLYEDGSNFKLKEKKMGLENLKVGDVIVNKVGDKKKVLGICGEVYFMSAKDNFNVYYSGYTLHDLKKDGYKVYTGPTPQPDPTADILDVIRKKVELAQAILDVCRKYEI